MLDAGSLNTLLLFSVAGVALIISPGPATLSMAATGARFGFKLGTPFLFGCATGLILVCIMAGLGISSILFWVPGLAQALTVVGMIYILYLAWRIATATFHNDSHQNSAKPPRYWHGMLLSLTNPKAYAVTISLFGSFPAALENHNLDLTVKLIILAIITVSGNLLWTWFGELFYRNVKSPKVMTWISRCFAALLVASMILPFMI